MKNFKIIGGTIVLFALIITISSCKKDIDLPISSCVAGTGGEVSVILLPEHHGDPIVGLPGYPDSAFIKFNATEYPGDDPDMYDLVVVGEVGEAEVRVNNLRCGKYFIYMTGKDASLDERVRGGIPVTIDQVSGIKTITIPITED